jgi:hypothetical protein
MATIPGTLKPVGQPELPFAVLTAVGGVLLGRYEDQEAAENAAKREAIETNSKMIIFEAMAIIEPSISANKTWYRRG